MSITKTLVPITRKRTVRMTRYRVLINRKLKIFSKLCFFAKLALFRVNWIYIAHIFQYNKTAALPFNHAYSKSNSSARSLKGANHYLVKTAAPTLMLPTLQRNNVTTDLMFLYCILYSQFTWRVLLLSVHVLKSAWTSKTKTWICSSISEEFKHHVV